jgi:sigma-B regulation protein RsbU (phosphoserine phosphatase)
MRILIAEDERITRRSLERELKRWGHDVVAVEDGAAAWDVFQREPFDIVVTDWDMPRMDGHELVRRIRAEGRTAYAYLLMLTARSETGDLVAGMEAGADDFLAKPFDRDELRVRLAAGERIIDLERSLADRNEKLHAANERMHQDLRAAAKIQQELLPTDLPEPGGLRFAWRYRPCDELGGDLLNVVPIGNGAVAIYLADVSGHGVGASLVSVSVHRSLSVRRDRSSLIMLHGATPGDARAAPPDQVARRLNALYPMRSNGGHFLTVVYATVDAERLRLEYCAAGHPGPTLARRGEPARLLETQGLPIGVSDDAEYDMTSVQLQEGDRVYLFSDGLMEAMNPGGQLFGHDRVDAVINETREKSLDESLDALIEAAVAWQGAKEFADDVSLLAMEASARDAEDIRSEAKRSE